MFQECKTLQEPIGWIIERKKIIGKEHSGLGLLWVFNTSIHNRRKRFAKQFGSFCSKLDMEQIRLPMKTKIIIKYCLIVWPMQHQLPICLRRRMTCLWFDVRPFNSAYSAIINVKTNTHVSVHVIFLSILPSERRSAVSSLSAFVVISTSAMRITLKIVLVTTTVTQTSTPLCLHDLQNSILWYSRAATFQLILIRGFLWVTLLNV